MLIMDGIWFLVALAGQLLGVAADTVYNDQEHEFTVAHAYLYPRRHGRKQLVPYCIAHGLTFLFTFIYNLMILRTVI